MKLSPMSKSLCLISRHEINKRKDRNRLGIIILCALMLPAVSLTAWANPECTVKTVKGRYLFAHSGTIVPPAFGVTAPTPGADAGFHIYNGDGTGTDIVTVRVNGEIFIENAAVPFTYTVHPDCTGTHTVSIPHGPSFDLFIAPDGKSIAFIATDPGNYVSAIDQMVSPK